MCFYSFKAKNFLCKQTRYATRDAWLNANVAFDSNLSIWAISFSFQGTMMDFQSPWMHKFIYKQISPKSNYFWLFFASNMTIFLYCFYMWCWDVFPVWRHRANSTQPLFSRPWFQKLNFEPKYLWKYLSVRRMVYFIRIVSSRWIFEKKMVIMTYAL